MKSLLVTTAAAILLAGTPVALAQPDHRGGGRDRSPNTRQEQARPDRGQNERGRRGEAPGQVQAAPAATPAPAQPAAPVAAQARPERQMRQDRQQRQQAAPVQAPAPVAPVQVQAGPNWQQGRDRQQWQANPQGTFRPQVQPQAAPQVQAVQRNQAVPQRHVQQTNQWQSGNQNWDRNTAWQRDRNWWRGNNAFRNYTGARANFFFAPGFGYYSVPRQYWRQSWHAGDYLPRYFMRYVVSDYRSYGLPRPPYNCRWIWVNNSILLVDRSDRYILDEVRVAW